MGTVIATVAIASIIGGLGVAVAPIRRWAVAEMLGHSQIAVTLDLYSHVTPTMQRQAADAMDAILGG